MHQQLEDRFADRKRYKAISAKIILAAEAIEISDDSGESGFFGNPIYTENDTLTHYLQFINSTHTVYAQSLGYHENGKNLTPHIHVHTIVENTKDVLKDRSKQRAKFARSQMCSMSGITERVQDLDDSNLVFNFLAYPMKEGKVFQPFLYMLDNKPMDEEMLLSLIRISRSIYEESSANQANRERSEERRKAAYNEMWEVAKVLKGQPGITKAIYNAYMHEAYFSKLDDDNLPNPKAGLDNSFKCAFRLGLVRYDI